MNQVVLLFQLPQEYRPFIKLTGKWRLHRREPFRHYSAKLWNKELILVETGMGKENAEEALEWMEKNYDIGAVLSCGFAGSLSEKFSVGQVVLGTEFHLWNPEKSGSSANELHFHMSEEIKEFCAEWAIFPARIVSSKRIVKKSVLATHYGKVPSVVDMESFSIARYARMREKPFFCFRAISDGLHEEISFELDDLCDAKGRVRIHKVLRLVLGRPPTLRYMYHHWRNASLAAKRLSGALASFLGEYALGSDRERFEPTVIQILGKSDFGSKPSQG